MQQSATLVVQTALVVQHTALVVQTALAVQQCAALAGRADSISCAAKSSMQRAMQHTALVVQRRQSSTVQRRAAQSMPCSTQHAEQTEQHAA